MDNSWLCVLVYGIYCAFWACMDCFNVVSSNCLYFFAGVIGTLLFLAIYLNN